MAVKVAINGFGRIGRCVARVISKRDDIELVAINDTASADMIEYLMKFDSVHGIFDEEVELCDGYLKIGTTHAKILNEKEPSKLKFAEYGTEVVLECTGLFLTQDVVKTHIENGCKKVIFSAPAQDNTPTYVLGVNAHKYSGENIISNASCTTNCLGPIAKILDDAFVIEKGLMTTIHSYTNDQNILDVKHSKDKRRSRAAAINMIPTSTGAAKAMKLIMPNLEGKLHGQSVRVPTPNVSMVDLNVVVSKPTTVDEVNGLLQRFASNELQGILGVDKQMQVSQDFCGNAHSGIVALDLTQVIAGDMIKVMAWYDNEWGYSSRLADMAVYIGKTIK